MNSKTRRDVAVALMLKNPLLLKKALNRPFVRTKKDNPVYKPLNEDLYGTLTLSFNPEGEIALPKCPTEWLTPRLSTGIPRLDELLGGGIREGLTLVFGGPGCGKTTLIRQCIKNGYEHADKVDLPMDFDYFAIYPNHSFSWGDFDWKKPLKAQLLEKKREVMLAKGMMLCQTGINRRPAKPTTANKIFESQKYYSEWSTIADVIIGLGLTPHQSGNVISVDILKNKFGGNGSLKSHFLNKQLVQI